MPYRGGGPALNDLVGGQIKYFFSNGSASVGLIQGGKVKAIVHTGKGRLGTLPDLPAAQDTIPGFEGYEWNGVFVPAGTSPDIIKKLNAGLNEVLRQPDIMARLKQLNVDSRANTPDEFRAFVAAETEKWGKVVRDAGIKLGSFTGGLLRCSAAELAQPGLASPYRRHRPSRIESCVSGGEPRRCRRWPRFETRLDRLRARAAVLGVRACGHWLGVADRSKPRP